MYNILLTIRFSRANGNNFWLECMRININYFNFIETFAGMHDILDIVYQSISKSTIILARTRAVGTDCIVDHQMDSDFHASLKMDFCSLKMKLLYYYIHFFFIGKRLIATWSIRLIICI